MAKHEQKCEYTYIGRDKHSQSLNDIYKDFILSCFLQRKTNNNMYTDIKWLQQASLK